MLQSQVFLIASFCAAILTCQWGRADSTLDKLQAPQKHVRILTVGNSFTRNATWYLDEITEAAGLKLTHKMLSTGGSSLELHADKALAFETDRSNSQAKYSGGESLQQALQSE